MYYSRSCRHIQGLSNPDGPFFDVPYKLLIVEILVPLSSDCLIIRINWWLLMIDELHQNVLGMSVTRLRGLLAVGFFAMSSQASTSFVLRRGHRVR